VRDLDRRDRETAAMKPLILLDRDEPAVIE
jgi:hypothetical protein